MVPIKQQEIEDCGDKTPLRFFNIPELILSQKIKQKNNDRKRKDVCEKVLKHLCGF